MAYTAAQRTCASAFASNGVTSATGTGRRRDAASSRRTVTAAARGGRFASAESIAAVAGAPIAPSDHAAWAATPGAASSARASAGDRSRVLEQPEREGRVRRDRGVAVG